MNCKLTSDQAIAIVGDPRRHGIIAAEYGIARAMVWRIKAGRAWICAATAAQSEKRAADAELLRHQVALCLCVHLSDLKIAELLGITAYRASRLVNQMLEETGMGNRIEFAIQRNAAVRDEYWDRVDAAA